MGVFGGRDETSMEELTIAACFLENLVKRGDQPALRWRTEDGTWVSWTWSELSREVARAAAGFAELGVTGGDRVLLMIRNVSSFHVADIALTFLGACPVSVYNSCSIEQIRYLAGHSQAVATVAEAGEFADKVTAATTELVDAAKQVHIGPASGPGVHWSELLTAHPLTLEDEAARLSPDDVITVIYTSGTTGQPKGVLLSHRNIVWTAARVEHVLGGDLAGWRTVSYLPMAHIGERNMGHYFPIFGGEIIHCCPDPSQILEYLVDVRPNIFYGAPRTWQKIRDRLAAGLAARAGDELTPGDPLALVGLDQIRWCSTGGAATDEDLLDTMSAYGLSMADNYGQSESTGPITFETCRPPAGTVGRALPGVELRLADDGELLFRGGNAFVGYLDDPDQTAAARTPDGFVRTGDLAMIDPGGYVSITGRKKELIITAGAKNVSPAPLEAAVRSACALIAHICVVGERRRYLTALVTLDVDALAAWCERQGQPTLSLAAAATDDRIRAEVQAAVDVANGRVSRPERIQKVLILPSEWTPGSNELTLTMKLRRQAINDRYAHQIDQLYEDNPPP